MAESRKPSVDALKANSVSSSDTLASKPPQTTEARKQKVQQQRSRRASRAHILAQQGQTRPARPSIPRAPSSMLPISRVQMRFPLPDLAYKTLRPIDRQHPDQKLVFLAGGMTAWRADLFSGLTKIAAKSESGLPRVMLMNPWLEGDGLHGQLTHWETEHFKKSQVTVFWFPKSVPCMISLLEFGTWALPQDKQPRQYKVVVGADPDYVRRATLATRCKGRYKLHDSLESLTQGVADALRTV